MSIASNSLMYPKNMVHEEALLVEGQPVSQDCLFYLSLHF